MTTDTATGEVGADRHHPAGRVDHGIRQPEPIKGVTHPPPTPKAPNASYRQVLGPRPYDPSNALARGRAGG